MTMEIVSTYPGKEKRERRMGMRMGDGRWGMKKMGHGGWGC